MKFDPIAAGALPTPIHPSYKSTLTRGPRHAPVLLAAPAAVERGPRFATSAASPHDADLTAQGQAEPIGQRIVVTGRVVDEDGRAVRAALVEIWQANAAGRYLHAEDRHDAPLDPNFSGQGRTLTDDEGRYRFVTIRPGAYPWHNQGIAWRPAHIHFSLFGNVHAQRLVTQMYFAGDPLLPLDPIFNGIADAAAREMLVSRFSLEETAEDRALGFVFDIVLRGRAATPFGL